MIPTHMIALKIVDRLEPSMSKSIALDANSDNFEIENGRKQLIARRDNMIKIVKEEIDNAMRTYMLR